MYAAKNKAFTEWEYKGILFEYPDEKLRSCECPNIVQVGDKWVLLVSPHGPVQYFVGDLDAEHCKFTWEKRGYVDRSTHFYATNVIPDEKDRKLMWGAIEGFQNTSGWNGINSLPREISLSENLDLKQQVPEEFKALRKGDMVSIENTYTSKKGTLELEIDFEDGTEGTVQIGKNVIVIKTESLEIERLEIPLEKKKTHKLHAYVDKSVMEVFIDDQETFTAMLQPVTENVDISKNSEKIKVNVYELDAKGLYTRF